MPDLKSDGRVMDRAALVHDFAIVTRRYAGFALALADAHDDGGVRALYLAIAQLCERIAACQEQSAGRIRNCAVLLGDR
jgi:hypothetical protein